ncbi:MAG: hypothetical protein QXR60_04740 [Candidatus Nanoarchaeia archaeon]
MKNLKKGFMGEIAKEDKAETPKVPVAEKLRDFNTQRDALFKALQGEKIESIKDLIADIQALIVQREALHKEILRDVDQVKMDINNFITALADSTNTREQLMMRQKQVEIDEVKIQEKVNKWRDIADLKRELRERIRELREKDARASMFDDILRE